MLRQLVKCPCARVTHSASIQCSVSASASAGGSDSTTPPPATQTPNKQFANAMNASIVDYDDPDYLPVPEYPVRPDEPLQTRKQRLLYQSRKRGMLENDILLSTFAARYLKEFTAEQTIQYDQLINGVSNDWDIYYWVTETKPTPPEYQTPVMELLKQHVRNVERESRLRQPDL